MSDLNTVALSGRLTADIELRYTPKGTAVAEVNLANETGWGDKKKTNFVGLTLWDKTAESAAKLLGKGRRVIVHGQLSQEEWEDKQTGQKKSKTRVKVDSWHFADDKPSGGISKVDNAAPQGNSEPASTTKPSGDAGDDDDDIPF